MVRRSEGGVLRYLIDRKGGCVNRGGVIGTGVKG